MFSRHIQELIRYGREGLLRLAGTLPYTVQAQLSCCGAGGARSQCAMPMGRNATQVTLAANWQHAHELTMPSLRPGLAAVPVATPDRGPCDMWGPDWARPCPGLEPGPTATRLRVQSSSVGSCKASSDVWTPAADLTHRTMTMHGRPVAISPRSIALGYHTWAYHHNARPPHQMIKGVRADYRSSSSCASRIHLMRRPSCRRRSAHSTSYNFHLCCVEGEGEG